MIQLLFGSLKKFFGDFGGDRDCDCRGDREIVGVDRGLVARRGRLVSDILRYRFQHHQRRSLDRRVADGLHLRPDVGDGYDSWQHEPIARHNSPGTIRERPMSKTSAIAWTFTQTEIFWNVFLWILAMGIVEVNTQSGWSFLA